MSILNPNLRDRPPRRGAVLLLLAAAIFVLFALVFSQAAFHLTFLRPASLQQTQVFAALSALIVLLLVALTFVLLRNLLKLYAERRIGVLGSNFRTRMVVAALLLSFAPVIVMFVFSYGLMNRSVLRWFSQPVEQMQQNSEQVAQLLTQYAGDNARAEAGAIAASPEAQRSFASGNFGPLVQEFRAHERSFQGGFALALLEGDAVAGFRAPEAWGTLRGRIPPPEELTGKQARVVRIAERDYLLGAAAVGPRGYVLVAMPLPEQFTATLNQLEQSQRQYWQLRQQDKQIRTVYLLLLLLLTVLVLFAATWLSLYVARFVTRPVSALAEAMSELSRGRLDYRVDRSLEFGAADELGELVKSFNRMAAELEANRAQIQAASREVADANTELDQRRKQIETILESLPTGVLSLDAARRVTRSNSVFARTFAASADGILVGTELRELFAPEVVEDLDRLLRKADRMGMVTAQMEIAAHRARFSMAVTAASLHHERQRLGYVLVFEDLTDLLKAQKQAAWREVARRVAHEIKNPLTPIALSAERIRRHLDRGVAPDEASLAVIHGCAETIAGAVDTVRTLVDEFSTLARFPASQPQPSNINTVVESALSLFEGRLEGIRIVTHLAPELPNVVADPDAIKRVVANLVDNAAEAMRDSLLREIHISTSLLPSKDAVEITVSDTGHGVTREVKEKLFLPYFSTKRRGTGLGLAIVARIIEDHQGSIRVEENQPLGARFIIELPLAAEGERAAVPEGAASGGFSHNA